MGDRRTAADRAAAGAVAELAGGPFFLFFSFLFLFPPFLCYVFPFFYIHFVVLGYGRVHRSERNLILGSSSATAIYIQSAVFVFRKTF